MSVFDDLVARYRGMSYGRLSGNNPSSVRSLLDEFNDRTYAQVLDPSQVTYLNGIPQNQWFYNDQGHLVFGMPGESVQGGLIGDGTTGSSGWPTYDPYTDYGDPGYAGIIPGEGGTGTGTTARTRPQQIGGGRDPNTGLAQASFTGNPDGTVSFSRNLPGSDTFTYNPDQEPNEEGYIEAYDEYGRKRNLKVNLLTQFFTRVAGLLDGEQDVAEATQISSRQPGLFGETGEADPEPQPSDRQPGLFGGQDDADNGSQSTQGQTRHSRDSVGGQNQGGPSGVGPSGNPAQGGQPHGGW